MKKIISVLVILVLLVGSLFILTGCKEDKINENEQSKVEVELETAELIYIYPWDEPVWKNYKVIVGYPKNDNWVAEDNSSNNTKELKLKDETRKLEIEIKVDQVSETTWNQNSKQRKESMNGTDNKWGEYEGFYYTIASNTYNGWLYLGNPSSIKSGSKGTHVNKLEFKIQSKGGSVSTLEELIKIMDEDILPNISWQEID